MADEYREVTTTSWGKRIVNSFGGIIFGIIFFIASFPLICWNEGRSVDRMRTLDEGRGLVVAVSSEQVNPGNNDALIHISGQATTDEILKDRLFGVQENALKLKRTAEMFQWKETKKSKTKKNLGGSETKETTYTYEKTWSGTVINSSGFKKQEGHENPASMPFKSETFTASDIAVGAFELTPAFINQINNYTSYPLSQENFDAMDERLKKAFILTGNEYFYGDPAAPQIGAIRVKYSLAKPAKVSLIGKQSGDSIETYYTQNGDISLLEMGNVGAGTIFTAAENENTLMTWLIRLGAFILMWLGLAMVFAPIKVIGDFIPLLGSLLGAGIGLVSGMAALILSFITMALAWIFFRPLIGITLLVIAGGLFFGGFKMIKERLQKAKKSPLPPGEAVSPTP